MKRNAKIIEISGFSGFLKAIFIVTCLIAGFVVFPGLVAMTVWNKFATLTFPTINLFQGVLLWAIIFITYFISTKKHFAICFGKPKELSDEEMSILMERIRNQSRAKVINQVIMKNIEEIKKEEASNKENQDSLTK